MQLLKIIYRTITKIYMRKNIKLQQFLNKYKRDVYYETRNIIYLF